MSKGVYFRDQNTRSPKFQDLSGQRFGSVKVEGLNRITKKATFWNCTCTCGKGFVRSGTNIKKSVHCGDRTNHAPKNGQSKNPAYGCWKAMIYRCTNRSDSGFFLYGGRGITVCQRWQDSFWDFLSDVGERPSPDFSLDREDVNGNYEPGNVKWATAKQQSNNRRSMPKRINFSEYQNKASMTAKYPGKGEFMGVIYCALGASGEIGELLNKIKKVYRDNGGEFPAAAREAIAHEVGDSLWYLSQLCRELDIDFSTVPVLNLEKLASRQKRNKIAGSGDNR